MHARGPSDLHVKRDLSKYVNEGVKQAQGRGIEMSPVTALQWSLERRQREKEGRGSRVKQAATNAKQFVGQDCGNKSLLCASHACQQHQHPTGMCNSKLSNNVKEFSSDLYSMSRTQIFRITITYEKEKQNILTTEKQSLAIFAGFLGYFLRNYSYISVFVLFINKILAL